MEREGEVDVLKLRGDEAWGRRDMREGVGGGSVCTERKQGVGSQPHLADNDIFFSMPSTSFFLICTIFFLNYIFHSATFFSQQYLSHTDTFGAMTSFSHQDILSNDILLLNDIFFLMTAYFLNNMHNYIFCASISYFLHDIFCAMHGEPIRPSRAN